MEGYVINATPVWVHAMKRAVAPGGKIYLKELYEQYGVKHGLAKGPEFVEWLRTVKLKDNKRWKFFLETSESTQTTEPTKTQVTKEVIKTGTDNVAPMVKNKLSVQDIVNMSVRTARESLSKVSDLNLLKYALQEANQLAGKDSLCKIIRKRIRDLQIAR